MNPVARLRVSAEVDNLAKIRDFVQQATSALVALCKARESEFR